MGWDRQGRRGGPAQGHVESVKVVEEWQGFRVDGFVHEEQGDFGVSG